MWNPESYRDTDFGLGPDETFEPKDDLDEEFRPADGEPYVLTVLGPIRPDEVGIALVREHLQWLPPSGSADPESRLDNPNAALQDLEAFFTVSGRTVVSASPAGAGRDARSLVWLARRAPVHIVGATGYMGGLTRQEMREAMSLDIHSGMDGTSARPGVFVVGENDDTGSAAEGAAIEEIGARRVELDLPVLALAPPLRQRDVVDRLEGAGVNPGRVIVAGAGYLPPADVAPLLNAGVWLLFDGLGASAEADQRQARLVASMAAEGFTSRILLAHAYRRRSLLTGYQGRPGLPYFIERFAVMLLEEGLEALDVRRMLVDNAVAALTIVESSSGPRRTDREG